MNFFKSINKTTKEDSATDSVDTVLQSPEKEEHPLTEIVRFSIIALIIVLPIRWFIAQPFIVSGASMETTFHNNEYLIVDQLSYHLGSPKRGEVVIFRYPKDQTKYFIKRVIGVPGDTIEINGDIVTIKNDVNPEGFVLDEPYVHKMEQNTFLTETLVDGEYFVMGDNRDASSDSRMWGVLQEDKIVGRALMRLFPFTRASLLPGDYDSEEMLLEANL
jgi:signal peptidase I